MITIQVDNTNGRQCKVHISWHGYTHSEGWTDTNGRIDFDVSSGTGTIYVDGKEVAKEIRIEGTVRIRKP